MKKFNTAILVATLFGLVSCGVASAVKVDARKEIDFDTLESNTFEPTKNTGELGTFDLISPFDGVVGQSFSEFSWEACPNATKYTLEICSSELFVSGNPSIDYYSKSNVSTNSLKIYSQFIFKNTFYYWRVHAFNDSSSFKLSSSTYRFFVEAATVEEVEFSIGDADDWILHSVGSPADISIDDSDFFDNGEDSLVVSFTKEDTSRGIPESDGWIVVTKTIEKSIYGTDALFFNMFYAGQDAQILIRLVDRDNEYWYMPVQISTNAKQSVILRFDEFIQRTRDVPVNNETFDYERIKYFEIVFEKTFGDGVLLLSNPKAIKYDNYRHYFIDKLNFNDYSNDSWVYESYTFDKTITDDYELKLDYYGSGTPGKEKINGYGFAKLNVNRFFAAGDAVKMSVKYTGNSFTNLILRIYEEDTDRYSYKVPYKSLTAGEYLDIVIPFKAFAKSAIQADGKRQFYFIKNLQFGLEGIYSEGSIYFKDFEIVWTKDYKTENYRSIASNGLIENFDQYKYTNELYFIWDATDQNKDEYISLNSENKLLTKGNVYCGQFEYKADMAEATYTIPVGTTDNSFTSFKMMMKDASIKSGNEKFDYLESVSPDVSVFIRLASGELYRYILIEIAKSWYEYDMAFKDFILINREEVPFAPNPITSDNIASISFSFKYYYFDFSGNPSPTYYDDNPVFVDNLYLGNATETTLTLKETATHQDENGLAVVEDFEGYDTTNDLLDFWYYGKNYDYQDAMLSDDVASNGGNHSGKFQFKSNSESPSYYIVPTLASDVTAKGIRFSLKSDISATVYINFYVKIGTNTLQYRATCSNVDNVWTEFAIGYSHFSEINGNQRPFTIKDLVNISRISFGVVGYETTSQNRYIYVDNITFDNALTYASNTRTVIE